MRHFMITGLRHRSISIFAFLTCAILIGFFAVVKATNDRFSSECITEEKGCSECEDDDSGDSQECDSSFNFSLNLGWAPIQREGNFLNYSRLGLSEGQAGRGYYRNFDGVLREFFNLSNMTNRQMERLSIIQTSINSNLYSPKVFRYSTHGSEFIENEGALRQVLTESSFTDVVTIEDGFCIKVWNCNDLHSLTKVGGFYTPPTTTPITEICFKNPDYPNENNRLLITKKENPSGSSFLETSILYDQVDDDNRVVKYYQGIGTNGNLLAEEILRYSNRGIRPWDYTLRRTVKRASNNNGVIGGLQIIAETEEVYQDFSATPDGGAANGKRLMSKTVGVGTSEANTITYDYYSGLTQPPADSNEQYLVNRFIHGRLKSIQYPDGKWQFWTYLDSEGASVAVETKYSSWKNVPFSQYTQGRKQETVISNNQVTRTTSIANQQISQVKMFTSKEVSSGKITYETQRWNGTEWAISKSVYASSDSTGLQAGRMMARLNEDGTAAIYQYEDEGGDLKITMIEGAGDMGGITDGFKNIVVYNDQNQITRTETVDVATGQQLSFKVGSDFDSLGRAQKWTYNGNVNDYETMIYGCCGLESSRSRSGATTTYYRDALKRVYRVTRKESAADVPVDTLTAYNGLTITTSKTDGTTTLLISESSRSLGGLTNTSKSPDANGDSSPETTTRVTTYPAVGGRVTTTTYPDNTATSITTFIDGSYKTSTDQEGYVSTYDKGTHNEQGGGTWTLKTSANGTQSVQNFSDHLSRNFKMQYADGAISTYTYFPFTAAAGSRGKMATTSDADENANPGSGSTISYTYNGEGERISITEALPSGQQRLTTMDADVATDTFTGAAYRTRTWVNGILTSTNLRSGDGYRSKSTTLSGTSTSVRTIPVDGAWTVTSTSADGQSTVQTYTEGKLGQTEMFDNQSASITSTSYTYDDLDRSLTTTDSRTGVTTINGYLENGAAISVTTNGGADTTSYTYDTMGRRTTTTLPDTTTTHTSYTARSQTLATWGSQTYARLYQYDALGRMSELRTYQNLAHGTEPSAATTGFASTQWLYDAQRGWLTEKNYDGETDNGTTDADYTYTAAGRLKTRTWERGVVTTYGYDQGLMVSTTYTNDPSNTPNVSYTYDNYGRPTTVAQTQNGTGTSILATCSYTYEPQTLVLDTETVSYDTNADGTSDFTRVIDRSQDTLLRPSGITLNDRATTEHTNSYSYDTAGRIDTVTSPVGNFTYGYEPNSYGLIKAVTGPAHTVTNTYEPSRNVLTNKENSVSSGTTVVSNFAYTVNNIGQRTNLITTGTAFTSSNTLAWSYNGAGEVTSADHSDNAQDRSFQYDGIGNRQKSVNSLTLPTINNYTVNALNQYTSFPSLPSAPSYDNDGNITSGPLPLDPGTASTLVWDAENRLISATVNTITTLYSYDAQSRRISKQVDTTPTIYYIYDGWNMLADYTIQNSLLTVQHSYTWGMDLSGSMQGAGGVGGLLAVTDHGSLPTDHSYYPTYDGNGNVSEYLDAAGTTVAHYEYDTFGNEIVAATSGSLAQNFAHRFSTKYLDDETGLYYYGYRYYDAANGRWINRDPIQEAGGYNIYGFVGNNGVTYVDYLGFYQFDTEKCLRSCGKIGGRNANGRMKCRNRCRELEKENREQFEKPEIPLYDVESCKKRCNKLGGKRNANGRRNCKKQCEERGRHRNRNIHNECPEGEPTLGAKDSKGRLWKRDDRKGEKMFHGGLECYRHENFQCCYCRGKVVTKGAFQGTYDYSKVDPDTKEGGWDHFWDDVWPHGGVFGDVDDDNYADNQTIVY